MRTERGFTLLEVLVAFFITTLSLGALFQIYAKGTTALDLAQDYAAALSIAESRLAETAAPDWLPAVLRQGRELDKYDWTLSTKTYLNVNLNDDASLSYRLLRVDVSVRWHSRGKTHEVALQTLKPVLVY